MSPKPVIGVLLSSLSDYEVVKPGLDLIESWGVPYEIQVASAHRSPDRVADWATEAERRGVQVVIAASGMAAHLPGLIAAHTLLPVIGLPVAAGAMQGQDALHSIVQMPPGVPVATVGINGSVNAAVLALQILARADARWKEPLRRYRRQLPDKIDQQNARLRLERPAAIWSDSEPPDDEPYEDAYDEEDEETPRAAAAPPPPPAPPPPAPTPRLAANPFQPNAPPRPAPPPAAPPPAPPSPTDPAAEKESGVAGLFAGKRPTSQFGAAQRRGSTYVGRIRLASEFLPLDLVEQAVDCLLEGGILAIPTDTVYGLAVDATHKEAVQRLYALKERSQERAMAVLIDSQKSLATLVKDIQPQLRSLLEAFWPGPLTVVFERKGAAFSYLGGGNTLGVRLPDHSVPLTLMQELHRPLACTSANPGGVPEAKDGDEIEKYFGNSVDMILDLGVMPPRPASTVIDVTRLPIRILREGAITRSQLAAVVGDLIQPE